MPISTDMVNYINDLILNLRLITDILLNPEENFSTEELTQKIIEYLFRCLKKKVGWKIEVILKKNLITF
jgi:hypothetical protein